MVKALTKYIEYGGGYPFLLPTQDNNGEDHLSISGLSITGVVPCKKKVDLEVVE